MHIASGSRCYPGANSVSHNWTASDYHAVWDAWEKQAVPGANERRDLAVRELKHCLETGRKLVNFSGEGLTTLPDIFPPGTEQIYADHCDLLELPENLPVTLKLLNISHSRRLKTLPLNLPLALEALCLTGTGIKELPQSFLLLEQLQMLDISHCQIEGQLQNLPPNIWELYAGDNPRLTGLTEMLPAELLTLHLTDCGVTTVPQQIFALSREAVVFLERNPLSLHAHQILTSQLSAVDYCGPQVYFLTGNNAFVANSLSDAILQWQEGDTDIDTRARWSQIDGEENAAAFARFLNRLAKTQSALTQAGFIRQVAEWLNGLLEAPLLRQETFAMAQYATTSCEDRVALSYCQMRRADILWQLTSGENEIELADFISAARQMFRLQQLEEIAREKANNHYITDEVEHFLAYPVKLSELLELSFVTQKMRFFDISDVTEDELSAALLRVKQLENETFPGWLSLWSPWQKRLQRLKPEINEQLESALEHFEVQLNIKLAPEKLENNHEARIREGKTLFEEMTGKIWLQLTWDVLNAASSTHLLEKKWPLIP